jgi:hypothetical protein
VLFATKEAGLEVNAVKVKYALLFRQKNVEQSQNMNVDNKYSENVANLQNF